MKMKTKFGTFRIILLCVLLLFIFLSFSGVALYSLEEEAQPEAFGSITDAIGYVSLTFLTIGYSDFGPVTLGGKLICIGVTILGGLLGIAIFVGIVVWIFRLVSLNKKASSDVINS